jgi:hypothetical protein
MGKYMEALVVLYENDCGYGTDQLSQAGQSRKVMRSCPVILDLASRIMRLNKDVFPVVHRKGVV